MDSWEKEVEILILVSSSSTNARWWRFITAIYYRAASLSKVKGKKMTKKEKKQLICSYVLELLFPASSVLQSVHSRKDMQRVSLSFSLSSASLFCLTCGHPLHLFYADIRANDFGYSRTDDEWCLKKWMLSGFLFFSVFWHTLHVPTGFFFSSTGINLSSKIWCLLVTEQVTSWAIRWPTKVNECLLHPL